VADELSLRRAAQRLVIAQPTVDQQMAGLEKSVGIRLLDRDGRGVRRTDARVASLVDQAAVRDRRADLVAFLTTTPIRARVVVRTEG